MRERDRFEGYDGVQARHAGKLLPLTRFGKDDAEITQGAVVSNQLLAGVLQHIKDTQAEKDVAKLGKLRTKREKRLLREQPGERGRHRAGLVHIFLPARQ